MRALLRSLALIAVVSAWAGLSASSTLAQSPKPIRIGEINSYTGLTAFTAPYRKGAELAIGEINEKGGVNGRTFEVLFRDDGFKPEVAVRHAEELIVKEKVDLLAGTFASNIGLAVADVAIQRQKLFVAAEPLTDALVWEKGSKYVFRLRPSTYMQAAMLAAEAAKLPAVKWASLAPKDEYGSAFVADFRRALAAKRADVEWVGEQWPAQGRLEAGPTVAALDAAKPDAIFNATFGPDLVRFVREGNARGLFEGRAVVSALTGEPEYLDPLKDETPQGWIVTGYPWAADQRPAHKAFVAAYQAKYSDTPRLGSLVGYTTYHAIAAMLAKAGSTDTSTMIAALEGLAFASPVGTIVFRAADHQSTMGAWVGKTALADGKPYLNEWKYLDGKDYLPPEADAAKLRPGAVTTAGAAAPPEAKTRK
jgi:branched-chain amino acid transport system substrate-binding protein